MSYPTESPLMSMSLYVLTLQVISMKPLLNRSHNLRFLLNARQGWEL